MISIIVSSYQEVNFKNFSESVKNTIGNIPYEIIRIWNPKLMGVCEAYNKGAEQANYDYLLFVHEDVLFITKNWGNTLLNHLKDKMTGAIGVAGSTYKSMYPVGWCMNQKIGRMYIRQGDIGKDDDIINPYNELKSKVCCLDGVFIATKREIWLEYKFDQSLLQGYHSYDIDFSLSVSQKYDVFVIYDILILHFPRGSANKEWLDSAIAINDKWKDKLPFSINTLTAKKQREYDSICFGSFVCYLKKNNYTKYKMVYYLVKHTSLNNILDFY